MLAIGKNELEERVLPTMETESQKSWDPQGPLEILCFNPLLKARTAEAGYPRPCLAGFRIAPKMQTPKVLWANSSSVQPSQTYFFIMFRRNFLCFKFCPLPTVRSLVFILMDKVTLTLLFTKLNNPSSQTLHVAWMLQSLIHDSLQYVCFFLVLGTVLQVQPHQF